MRGQIVRRVLLTLLLLSAAACGGAAGSLAGGDGSTPMPVEPPEASIGGAIDGDPGSGEPLCPPRAIPTEGVDCGPFEEPTGTLVTPAPGLEQVHPVQWRSAEPVGPDRTTVRVEWVSGVEPCHVLDRVKVDETSEAVKITVYEGSEPADQPQACIEIAQFKAYEVELAEPLGGREIVDGAA